MTNENIERRKNMINIISQNEEFIIIGLTGRIGSGCSETARILASDYQTLELPWIQPGSIGFSNNEEREKRILQRYASSHWIKFDIIRTRSIISCYLLENLDDFLIKLGNYSSKDLFEAVIDNLKKDNIVAGIIDNKVDSFESYKNNLNCMINNIKSAIKIDDNDIINIENEYFNKIKSSMDKDFINEEDFLIYCYKATNELGSLYNICEKTDNGKCICERGRFIPMIDKTISYISKVAALYIIMKATEENVFLEFKKISDSIDEEKLEGSCGEDEGLNRYKRFVFVHDIVDVFSDSIHKLIDKSSFTFTELYQKYGNSIRCYGKIYLEQPPSGEIKEVDVFSIPNKIVKYIKILRHPFINKNVRPVRIAIDSIKNVFEADYLRQRYSSFYLFAISTDNDIRKRRLMNGENKRLTMQQIKFADWNEYSSEGYKIYKRTTDDIDEINFKEKIESQDDPFSHDFVRLNAYKNKLYQFYLQDVAVSIENADIFISNNYDNTISKNMDLRWSVVRNICLIMFPGLLVPTPIERCMQIAFAAKCNSGCLSRQVGAVVTDKEFNILSIGWNDVPCGDISCSHKNLVDLCKWEDKLAYSTYELENLDFRERIKNFEHQKVSKILLGLPMRYCFKDIHSSEKNPMRSRAMHAEEKALALCGEMCKDGYLFTTSSPCEMCSKNAKNHRIKKIYYIELYPGISESQYTNSGDKNNIAEHILFTGAIGRAYTKMYTPFMPQKDILDMLGVYDECGQTLKKDKFHII